MNEAPCRAAYEWLVATIGTEDAERLLWEAFVAGFVLMPIEQKRVNPKDLN